MKFLLDASSVVEIVRALEEEKALRLLSENSILDLTKYEVGNAIWKEHVLHRTISEEEFLEFFSLLQKLVSRTNTLLIEPQNLSEAGEIAAKEKMTYYDASYITIAKIRRLILVTEDGRLRQVAAKHTKTAATHEVA